MKTMDKKPELSEDNLWVNKETFMNALEDLHVYHGDLLGNLEQAEEYGEPEEWIEDLQMQISIVKLIYDKFIESAEGYNINLNDKDKKWLKRH